MPTACPAKTVLKLIFFVSETDAATTSDHDRFVVKRIVDVGQSGVAAGRRLIDLRGTFHVQSFVGTFVVEDLGKFVKARLLLKKICGGGFGRFFFKVTCMRS